MEKDTKHTLEIQRLTEERDQARRFLIDANNTISERENTIAISKELVDSYVRTIEHQKHILENDVIVIQKLKQELKNAYDMLQQLDYKAK